MKKNGLDFCMGSNHRRKSLTSRLSFVGFQWRSREGVMAQNILAL